MPKIKVIVETTKTGYSAFTENHPVFTTGANKIDLQNNVVEAFQLYSNSLASDKTYTKEDFQFHEEA